MPRLLACKSCGVMFKMLDYDGPAEYDMELIELINKHLHQAKDPRPESHLGAIFRCDEDTWNKLGDETEIRKELMKNEWDIRELRQDLKVDALRCFNKHNRPDKGCPDFEDISKVIGRKHNVPRENLQYLCHHCPAAAFVTHQNRIKKGMYD